MPLKNYYTILGVSGNATQAQIKRAYRRLARMYHPDLNKQAPDSRIKQINEAYAVLSDASRRAAYDILLLEEMRHELMREALRRQQQAHHEPRMTWREGIAGFFTELKKGLQEG